MSYKSKKAKRWTEVLEQINKSKEGKRKERILLIDGLNLYIRSFSAVPTTNQRGNHTGGIYGSLNSLRSSVKKLRPTRVIVIFDGKGGSVRRRKLYSEYKQNRCGMKGLNRTIDWNSEEEEEKSCKKQLQRFIEYLKYLPVTSFSVDNIEADDAIAYVCTEIIPSETCIIMSTDKDYLQLVDEGVDIWSPTKKKVYTPDLVKKEYHINPKNILLWRIIEGDKSDNIPGVKGVSIKTIQKYFKDVLESDEKIDLEQFIEHIDFVYDKNKKSKRVQKLYKNKDILRRNYKLMQLQNVDISGTSKSQIIDIVKNREIPTLKQTKLRKLFMEDMLYSQIRNFSSWYLSFQSLNSNTIRFNKKLRNENK